MPINLISKIKPKNDGQFPTIEDIDLHGGYQVRADLSDRNSIPLLNRKEGMMVYTQSDSKYYTLNGGLTDGYWTEISFGGSSITDVFIVNEDRLVVSGSSENIISSNTDFISRTITLPDSPTIGQEIIIARSAYNANSILNINFNGATLDDISINWSFNSYAQSFLHVIYDGNTWVYICSREYSAV